MIQAKVPVNPEKRMVRYSNGVTWVDVGYDTIDSVRDCEEQPDGR